MKICICFWLVSLKKNKRYFFVHINGFIRFFRFKVDFLRKKHNFMDRFYFFLNSYVTSVYQKK